ncbi:hypothetical protein GGX14DRAFT_383781 [Mycena pura]|uniref:Uncharacterized protein n=1 Tax=Mycena pura TaxID=153505 RepID=A0AAD7E607_9AGAR|nr:hypothetical protein GGX14DRAFT_383781 [Mycena pura]
MRECIAEMRQSFGHMHQNKAEKSRKASEGRRVERGCAAKLHERTEMKRSEAPKFNDQYRSNRLKAIGCERALGSKGFGQLHQRADGTAHKCARTERAGRKQTQGSEDRGWLHRARMSSWGAVGVPRSKHGDAGRVKGSEYREWLQRARMRSRSADGALGRQPEGAGKICGQVETGCRPNLKPALSGWHGTWWPCGRRAQPHLGVDRSTDAPEHKGRSEVQDDKTPRRSNDADGPGRGVNDHQLRVGKRLGVPSIATGVRGCSRGHRGTAGRPRMRCGSPDRASEHLRFRNQVTTSSGGAGPGDDIIDLSRSNSDAIKRARDVTWSGTAQYHWNAGKNRAVRLSRAGQSGRPPAQESPHARAPERPGMACRGAQLRVNWYAANDAAVLPWLARRETHQEWCPPMDVRFQFVCRLQSWFVERRHKATRARQGKGRAAGSENSGGGTLLQQASARLHAGNGKWQVRDSDSSRQRLETKREYRHKYDRSKRYGHVETLDSRSPCDSSEMSDEAQIKL